MFVYIFELWVSFWHHHVSLYLNDNHKWRWGRKCSRVWKCL